MVFNTYLFLGIVFLLTFLLGRIIEKIKVPWVFSALIVGAVLSFYNPFLDITSSDTFLFLAQLGMYFLLFIIGYEIDITQLKKNSRFILTATFFIIFFEAIFGSIIVHLFFHYSWFISFIISLSLATVGEAVLVPILHEFKIVNTKLGQSIIGIGTFDDVIEIFLLILIVFVVGRNTGVPGAHVNSVIILVIVFGLFILTYGLTRLRDNGKKFSVVEIEMLFLLTLFILFLFLGVGEYAHAAPIAAFLSGIAIRTFIPNKRLKTIENDIRALCYGFFAPLFFLWVGLGMDLGSLVSYPLIILIIIVVSSSAKIVASYLIGKKELGTKQSILLGVGLSVRFSTSIIILKILYENGLMGLDAYSVIIASSIIFQFVVPVLFASLVARWKIGKSPVKKR